MIAWQHLHSIHSIRARDSILGTFNPQHKTFVFVVMDNTKLRNAYTTITDKYATNKNTVTPPLINAHHFVVLQTSSVKHPGLQQLKLQLPHPGGLHWQV